MCCSYDVHFFWVEVMEYGTEGQAISPGRAEVGDFYPAVLVGDVLTPLEQRLAGVHQVLQEDEDKRFGAMCCARLCILCFVLFLPQLRRPSCQPPL